MSMLCTLLPGEEVLAFRVRHILPASHSCRLPKDDLDLIVFMRQLANTARIDYNTVCSWLLTYISNNMPNMDETEKQLTIRRFNQAFKERR